MWAGAMAVATATSFQPLTLEQLSGRADRVAHGRVGALETRRDGAGHVFTRVTLESCEVWSGPGATADGCVELDLGGGVLGDERHETVGQAGFGIGDEVVVFLARNPAGDWTLLGLDQGRFEVLRPRELATEGPWVRNRFWGGRPGRIQEGAEVRMPNRIPLTLAELKRRVREARR